MIEPRRFVADLADLGFGLYSGVPCSIFKGVLNALAEHPGARYVPAANEGAALGVAAGGLLAGTRAAVLLQNSGLGNLVNPLTSLAVPYELPCLLLVSWRGCPDEPADEPQHRLMGRATPGLLDLLGIAYRVLPADPERVGAALAWADAQLRGSGRPVALLLRKGTFADHAGPAAERPQRALTRADVMRAVVQHLSDADAVVATTGMSSRELFAVRDRPTNFYMQGSMGHAAAIGLGAALADPGRRVVVFDGDGAALMHLGTLSTVGATAPANLLHVVVDNESYDSTGDQDTTAASTDLAAVARGCGYRQVLSCDTPADLDRAVASALALPGPTFLHAKVRRVHGHAPPRVTTALGPAELARRFQQSLRAPAAPAP